MYLPWWGEFYILWCNTVDQVQSFSGRLQKWVPGLFRGLWWFMTSSKTQQLLLMPAWLSQSCPIRRDEHLQACLNVLVHPLEQSFHTWASCATEDIGMIKSTFPAHRFCFLSASSFTWLETQVLAKSILICPGHPLALTSPVPGLLPFTSSANTTAFANGWLSEPLIINISASHTILFLLLLI